jgi:hypothetical protein
LSLANPLRYKRIPAGREFPDCSDSCSCLHGGRFLDAATRYDFTEGVRLE